MATLPVVSGDGRILTFTLRNGLKYSDGHPLTARDFVFGWRRHLDPRIAGEYAFLGHALEGGEALNAPTTRDPAVLETLRLGLGVRAPNDPSQPTLLWKPEFDNDPEKLATRKRMRAVWLSERDCIQLIERCLESDRDWVLCYGISDNPRRFWDIEHAKDVLGYAPRDAAPEELVPSR